MIADPPFDVGALQVTVASPFPAVAPTAVGAPGAERGVTGLLGADGALDSYWFVATTVNV